MIEINTIPTTYQRYDTVGDWYYVGNAFDDKKKLVVNVSNIGNADAEFAIAIHELVEAYLCTKRGVTAGSVDAFDMSFSGDGEPGDDELSPYYREHQFASIIEHMIINEFGLNWTEHNKMLENI